MALCLLVFALAGCARYEESIVLDANGAGTATLTLSWPQSGSELGATLLAELFGARFGESAMTKDLPPGVTCAYSRSESGGRATTRAAYRFDDINTLVSWAARTGSPLDNVSITRTEAGFEYTRMFGRLRPEEMAMVRAAMADALLIFSFTGPGTLMDANANQRDGNTALWEFKAPDMFEGLGMTAQYRTGVPPWVWHLAMGGAVGAAGAVIYLRRKRKTR